MANPGRQTRQLVPVEIEVRELADFRRQLDDALVDKNECGFLVPGSLTNTFEKFFAVHVEFPGRRGNGRFEIRGFMITRSLPGPGTTK